MLTTIKSKVNSRLWSWLRRQTAWRQSVAIGMILTIATTGLAQEGSMKRSVYDTQTSSRNPDLKSLDRLVGTWKISDPSGKGEIRGQVTYEWMEGGFFLMQTFDFVHSGRKVKGIEVIGHERAFGAVPGEEIKSRVYDNAGNTLDYVYELENDTLIIWGGQKGSPAYFKGKFSADNNSCTGGWVYPGGGGYQATMTRVKK
jgi:hypothetical protein